MNAQAIRLNVENSNLQDEKSELEKKYSEINTSYNVALIGLLIGVLLLVFGSMGLALVGGVLTLAGILAGLTQGSKRRDYVNKIETIQKKIKENRAKLIELSALE